MALPIDGRHRFQGRIKAVEDDRIQLDQDGKDVHIVHANIVKAKLVPDYAALGFAAAPKKNENTGSRKRGPKHK